jgi:predicted Zn-dependent protease
MVNLSWNELDEKQKEVVLNAGHIFGLDHSRVPEPRSFS